MPNQPPPDDQALNDAAIDLFANIHKDIGRGGAAYGHFFGLFCTLQDAVTSSDPPESVWDEASTHVEATLELLEPWEAPEWERPAGTRVDLPGRGNPMLIPFDLEQETSDSIRGRTRFRPFHLGGNGAAHGGTLPLLFDDVMGRIANAGSRSVARTAYLTVNYRKITPIGEELEVEATVDRIEGRKRWVTGRLFHKGVLVADADALFVELLPGQP
jgi:acyl-coenzyme A thioesterase PaaI-like protein